MTYSPKKQLQQKALKTASFVKKNIIKKQDKSPQKKSTIGAEVEFFIPEKNIILFINLDKFEATKNTIVELKKYAKCNKKKFRFAVIYDSKKYKINNDKNFATKSGVDILIPCDFSESMKIEKALIPFKEELLAITARSPESNIPIFAKIVPHVPYLKTPTVDSLAWSIDKIAMRERLFLHDKTITPKFKVVEKFSKKIIKEIKDEVGFPLVIKPTGLAQSLLVSVCFHQEELEDILKKTFRKIKTIYKENNRTTLPKILVEQFMEGDMYSVDAYTDSKGTTNFCPLVYVKTGRSVGFDDFFSYQAMTPTTLKKIAIEKAQDVATKTIYALGLRNTTVHIELMKTNDGWKTIELGPRIGGFRHLLYKFSYGIEHELNDVLIRMSRKIHVPRKPLGCSVAIKFFAKEEGVITEIKGIKRVKELSSFKEIKINHKIGDKCLYAKHGGKSVFNLIMFNKNRSDLLADIRRAEQSVIIKTIKKVEV